MADEIGKVSLGAELNTQELDQGVARAKQGLGEVGDSANSVENDLKRAGSGAGGLGKKLAFAGIAGVTAFAALASKAPATAGSMANIRVQTERLSRVAGEILAPAFDSASQNFAGFVDSIEANQGVISSFVVDMTDSFGKMAKGVGESFTTIKTAFDVISGFVPEGAKGFFGKVGERVQENAYDLVRGGGIPGMAQLIDLLGWATSNYMEGRKERENRNEADLN